MKGRYNRIDHGPQAGVVAQAVRGVGSTRNVVQVAARRLGNPAQRSRSLAVRSDVGIRKIMVSGAVLVPADQFLQIHAQSSKKCRLYRPRPARGDTLRGEAPRSAAIHCQ